MDMGPRTALNTDILFKYEGTLNFEVQCHTFAWACKRNSSTLQILTTGVRMTQYTATMDGIGAKLLHGLIAWDEAGL
jgi:hypothetical protein